MPVTKNLPGSRPQLKKAEALNILSTYDLSQYPVVLLGIRGYYRNTMGKPVINDRGIYDDALFIVSPDLFVSFNANTDPSIHRTGVAVLKPGGPYLYKVGLHNMRNPYEALRQHGTVTVIRDKRQQETDRPDAKFYINIHKGGFNTTSSLGCQTIYPLQWNEFLSTVKAEIKKHKQTIIPYILIESL